MIRSSHECGGWENGAVPQSIADKLGSSREFELHDIAQLALLEVVKILCGNHEWELDLLSIIAVLSLVSGQQFAQVVTGGFQHLKSLLFEHEDPLFLADFCSSSLQIIHRVGHFMLHGVFVDITIFIFLHRDDVRHLQNIEHIVFPAFQGATLNFPEALDYPLHEHLIPKIVALLEDFEDVLGEVTHLNFVFEPLLIQMPLRFLRSVHLKKAGANLILYKITTFYFLHILILPTSDQFFCKIIVSFFTKQHQLFPILLFCLSDRFQQVGKDRELDKKANVAEKYHNIQRTNSQAE